MAKIPDRPVSAGEMEAARAERAAHRAELLEETGAASLIQFTVIAPGPNKRDPAFRRLFVSGRRAVIEAFLSSNIVPLKIDVLEKQTGNELYLAMYLPPLEVKRRMAEIEEVLPFGRLLNIDVYAGDGTHIPRTAIGLPERCCLVCVKPGTECARAHAHAPEEVREIIDRILEESALVFPDSEDEDLYE